MSTQRSELRIKVESEKISDSVTRLRELVDQYQTLIFITSYRRKKNGTTVQNWRCCKDYIARRSS